MMSSFTANLRALADRSAYTGQGEIAARWGQLMRESPDVKELMQRGKDEGKLVPLSDLATVRGGVVTRANAFFIVEELPFDKIPARFRITRRDYSRVTVVMDGLQTPHKLERAYLRPIVMGPESLTGPRTVAKTQKRLLDVTESKEELRKKRANGTVAYLRRGETVSYSVSADKLKGGIPAQRSNIKNRRPHWYSLNVAATRSARIVVPEHMDTRYIATLVEPDDDSVVIDKLYLVEPSEATHSPLIHLSLNSILTWYQIELRGRTQLGQGVLELKVPDWRGILVLHPDEVPEEQRSALIEQFSALTARWPSTTAEALDSTERIKFDNLFLAALGVDEPEEVRLTVERRLRAAISERRERARSVAEEKQSRSKRRAPASVDAYATRIAAQLESFPDPRTLVDTSTPVISVAVAEHDEGTVRVGDDLFTHSDVFVGQDRVAATPDTQSADFVRGVLLHDPHVVTVEVPTQPELSDIVARWNEAAEEWRRGFLEVFKAATSSVDDDRLRAQIHNRALVLLHAV